MNPPSVERGGAFNVLDGDPPEVKSPPLFDANNASRRFLPTMGVSETATWGFPDAETHGR